MTTDAQRMTAWQRWLYSCGFNKYQWFRRWVGGLWFVECSLGYAIRRAVLIQNPQAYITRKFTVIMEVEDYRPAEHQDGMLNLGAWI